jgi:hypothetical protein
MIPASHGTLRVTGEPALVSVGTRWRTRGEDRVLRLRRQRMVPVACACGKRYSVELAKWLHRPPTRCLRCHHASMRGRCG